MSKELVRESSNFLLFNFQLVFQKLHLVCSTSLKLLVLQLDLLSQIGVEKIHARSFFSTFEPLLRFNARHFKFIAYFFDLFKGHLLIRHDIKIRHFLLPRVFFLLPIRTFLHLLLRFEQLFGQRILAARAGFLRVIAWFEFRVLVVIFLGAGAEQVLQIYRPGLFFLVHC